MERYKVRKMEIGREKCEEGRKREVEVERKTREKKNEGMTRRTKTDK